MFLGNDQTVITITVEDLISLIKFIHCTYIFLGEFDYNLIDHERQAEIITG